MPTTHRSGSPLRCPVDHSQVADYLYETDLPAHYCPACGQALATSLKKDPDPVPPDWEDQHIRAEEGTDHEEEYYLGDRWDDLDDVLNGYVPKGAGS